MDLGISIIIPCYNASKTIERCLGSILKQNFRNREIICIDDASIDDTVSKIKRFESVRILINRTAKGAAYSRNRGLRYASYPKILFVDSDIFLPSNFLEEINALKKKYELIYPNVLNEDNTPITPSYNYRNIWGKKAQNYPLCSACFLIKKKAINKLDELFDITYKIYYEDTDLFLRCYYFRINSKYADNITAYHALKPDSAQKWSKERLYLECRNTLYAIIKFFPLNFFFPVNYAVRLGMFIHYFRLFREKHIETDVNFKTFLKIVGKSIYWNLINLPVTFRKNINLKRKLTSHLLTYE